MVKSSAWFTMEDAKASFNLFCCVYGVGTLGMPGNFARAGPALAIVAMLFMAFANIYASVVISKVMLIAPKSVKTFGDLGEWCMGKTGRWTTVVSQMGVCILLPCLYLVLGGTLLKDLFPNTFEEPTWIILMAVSLLPVCLIPTLKEGAGAAFAGCMGTLIADIIGVAVLIHGMRGHPSVPSPDISFKQVVTTFGNLSLAYGAGIVIPALQREHSEPERMPRVIFVTLALISGLFFALAAGGYAAVGCQIAGNLLFSIFPNAATGQTKLGFRSHRGVATLAFLFMQLHITIAFAVILHPALYLIERMFLGMHKHEDDDVEALTYAATESPGDETTVRGSTSHSALSATDSDCGHEDEHDEAQEYKGHEFKYIPMRIVVVALMTTASVALKDHFSDLQDFVGASCITLSCIVLPVVFYFRKLWTATPLWEKTAGSVVIVVCLALGTYVTVISGKTLFNPGPADPANFPFCHDKYKYDLYFNATAAAKKTAAP